MQFILQSGNQNVYHEDDANDLDALWMRREFAASLLLGERAGWHFSFFCGRGRFADALPMHPRYDKAPSVVTQCFVPQLYNSIVW